MNLANRTIAVIGLGYVGLPLAVEFGKKRPVIGFDVKADYRPVSKKRSGSKCPQAKLKIFSAAGWIK